MFILCNRLFIWILISYRKSNSIIIICPLINSRNTHTHTHTESQEPNHWWILRICHQLSFLSFLLHLDAALFVCVCVKLDSVLVLFATQRLSSSSAPGSHRTACPYQQTHTNTHKTPSDCTHAQYEARSKWRTGLYFGKYTYSLSCQELDEKIDTRT